VKVEPAGVAAARAAGDAILAMLGSLPVEEA
jgi:hypothetical protein